MERCVLKFWICKRSPSRSQRSFWKNVVCLVVISLSKHILLKAVIWQFSGVVFCYVAQVGCTFANPTPLLQPAEKMTRKATIAATLLKFLNKESQSSKDELFPQAAVLGRASYDVPRPKRRWPALDKVVLFLLLIPRKKIFECGQDGEVEDYVYGLNFSEKGSGLRVVQGVADITETDRILTSTQSGKYKTWVIF